MAFPESAGAFLERHKARLQRLPRHKRIVFPEGDDPRVHAAAERLARENVLKPILLSSRKADIDGVSWIDPATCPDAKIYGSIYWERRKSKGVTEVEAM